MNMPERAAPAPHGAIEMPVDDLLAAIEDSKLLVALEINSDDLALARTDSDLLSTLRIAYEFFIELRNCDVLEVFLQLPARDQAGFIRWIGTTADADSRRHRIDIFVLALRMSPLGGRSQAKGSKF
jgi:hypothetical protein